MPNQGHVATTDYDGNPLLIVFLLKEKEDAKSTRADLNNTVEVLRGFATAWNRGEQDCKDSKQQHWSTVTPSERKHITLKPASDASWGQNPPFAKGIVHVYSVGDSTASGFDSYLLQSGATNTFNSSTVKRAIADATANEYTQSASSESQGGSSSKSHGSSSKSHASSSKSHESSSKSHGSSSKSHGSSSKSHASSSKSHASSSKSEEQPAGYFENGVAYYYSESKGTYYYIGEDGKGHSC